MRAGRSAVELSVHPLVSLIHKENLGDPHPVFAGSERYVSHRFAGDAERELRVQLAEAGLVDRAQVADFTGMLSIVQRARIEFLGWVTSHDEAYSVLVAAHGRNAFALTRRGERVAFRRVSPDRMAEALLDRLPDTPPGRGESMSVSEAEIRRPRGEQARRLDALLRTPRQAITKIYAAHRDDAGNRIRSRTWLDLIDLPDGRWAVYTTKRTVNAAAATSALVAAKVSDLR